MIKVIVPPMSEERRRDLVKLVKGEAEKGRVAIRNVRKNIKDKFKDLQMSQDDVKKLEKSLQDLTDRYIKDIDSSLKRKEEELMSI
jgi:ribosome recycling factor